MKVLVLSNGKLEEKDITNDLAELQAIVDGYIEIPFISKTLNDNGVDVIINEEGKYIEGLKPEIAVIDKKTNSILDVIMGNCIFASHDAEGETISLSKEQIQIVQKELRLMVTLCYSEESARFSGEELIVRAVFI